MSREALIGPVRRTDRWTVPPVAVREAIINAIVHADYAERGSPIRVAVFNDRIEVENPGLLPLGLTIDDIRKGVSKSQEPGDRPRVSRVGSHRAMG